MGKFKEKIDELADNINKLGSNDKNGEQDTVKREAIERDDIAASTNLINDIVKALTPYSLVEDDIPGFELYINDETQGDLLFSVAQTKDFANNLKIKLKRDGFSKKFSDTKWTPRSGTPPKGIQTTYVRPGIYFCQKRSKPSTRILANAIVSARAGELAQTSYTLVPAENNRWNIGRGPNGNEGFNNIEISDEGDDVLVVSSSHAYIAYSEQNGFMVNVYDGGRGKTKIFRNGTCVKQMLTANPFRLEYGDEIVLCDGVVALLFKNPRSRNP